MCPARLEFRDPGWARWDMVALCGGSGPYRSTHHHSQDATLRDNLELTLQRKKGIGSTSSLGRANDVFGEITALQ